VRTEGNGARVYHSTADQAHKTGKRGFSEASLTTRVQRYFEANPGEWLTWEDACTKFNCGKPSLKSAMDDLREQGRLNVRVVSVLCVVDKR